MSRSFQEEDVDQIALFGASDQRGELVGQDLVGRIDEHAAHLRQDPGQLASCEATCPT